MRQHDGFGARADGGFDQVGVDVVCERIDIDEHRQRAKLDDGVDGGRETGGHGDDFIAFADGARAQLGRGQGVEGHQIGRRAGVDGDQVLDADKGGELALKLGVEAPGGEPAVKAGLHHELHLAGVEQLARWGNGGLAGNEGLGGQSQFGVLLHQGVDLAAQGVGLGVNAGGRAEGKA